MIRGTLDNLKCEQFLKKKKKGLIVVSAHPCYCTPEVWCDRNGHEEGPVGEMNKKDNGSDCQGLGGKKKGRIFSLKRKNVGWKVVIESVWTQGEEETAATQGRK